MSGAIELQFDPAAVRAEPQGEAVPGAEGDEDTTVSFVDMLGGALAAAAIAIQPPVPAQPAAPSPDASGRIAAQVPAAGAGALPAVSVPAPQVSLPGLASDGATQPGAAATAVPAPELPFAEIAAQLSIDTGDTGDAAAAPAPEIVWTGTAARAPDAAATAGWAPFRAPRAVTFTASHQRAGTPLVAAIPGAAAPGQAAPVDPPLAPGALGAPDAAPTELGPIVSASSRTGAASALSHLARSAAADAELPAVPTPPTGAGELAPVEAGRAALPARPLERSADEAAGPPVHAVHLPAHQGGADPTPADAPARLDVTPSARAEDGNQLPGSELGHSSARITVGEGEDRVSLLIALRGEHVRVEARAHSAMYADVLHQRADELATGLAERGLVLGSLSADVSGEQAAHSTPQQPDERSGRRSGEERPPDPEPRPDRPRPRGVRAIA